MYKAEMIADSISPERHRISTMLVTMPRIMLAEFNTHRAFSRNSSSSRAIPTEKMLKSIMTNPFVPIKWLKTHSGMQGTEFITDPVEIAAEEAFWLADRDYAVSSAQRRMARGITKQLANRQLEPFMWHTVLVTATDWENFFALRSDPAADIHIQPVADLMLECLNTSVPKELGRREWHIPYGDQLDIAELEEVCKSYFGSTTFEDINKTRLAIATARCAQTSYTLIGTEGKATPLQNLIILWERLSKQGHWSPFEHCAESASPGTLAWNQNNGRFGNFMGWKQYRKHFKDENRTDSRLIKH